MPDIQQRGADEVFCSSCGAIIKKDAEICPKCGVRQRSVEPQRVYVTSSLSEMAKEVNEYQSATKSVLFACPKCECSETKITGKKSYFGAIGWLFLGFILAFIAPFIIAMKVLLCIITFKFTDLAKLVVRELWSDYVIWAKSWLIVLTFGIANLTKVYTCEKCGKKWVV